ncbi:MAG: EF-hand domain-containing protein [Gammaproteobacteria bacterium]
MSELDEDKLAEIKENFAHFDADGNGVIDYSEFKRLIDALDGNMQEEELQVGFDLVDSDNNGRIDVDEFINWWQEQG